MHQSLGGRRLELGVDWDADCERATQPRAPPTASTAAALPYRSCDILHRSRIAMTISMPCARSSYVHRGLRVHADGDLDHWTAAVDGLIGSAPGPWSDRALLRCNVASHHAVIPAHETVSSVTTGPASDGNHHQTGHRGLDPKMTGGDSTWSSLPWQDQMD
nr:hypothetical protein CFP56_20898 [Quercus suber]